MNIRNNLRLFEGTFLCMMHAFSYFCHALSYSCQNFNQHRKNNPIFICSHAPGDVQPHLETKRALFPKFPHCLGWDYQIRSSRKMSGPKRVICLQIFTKISLQFSACKLNVFAQSFRNLKQSLHLSTTMSLSYVHSSTNQTWWQLIPKILPI